MCQICAPSGDKDLYVKVLARKVEHDLEQTMDSLTLLSFNLLDMWTTYITQTSKAGFGLGLRLEADMLQGISSLSTLIYKIDLDHSKRCLLHGGHRTKYSLHKL